jgi:hypothetical protein
MRTAAMLIAAAGLAAWGAPASARISDVDYIQASRCHAIAAAAGGANADAFKSYLKTEGRGRHDTVTRMADQAAAKAKRQATAGSAEKRAAIEAELGGVCQVFLGTDQTTGQAAKSEKSPAS